MRTDLSPRAMPQWELRTESVLLPAELHFTATVDPLPVTVPPVALQAQSPSDVQWVPRAV